MQIFRTMKYPFHNEIVQLGVSISWNIPNVKLKVCVFMLKNIQNDFCSNAEILRLKIWMALRRSPKSGCSTRWLLCGHVLYCVSKIFRGLIQIIFIIHEYSRNFIKNPSCNSDRFLVLFHSQLKKSFFLLNFLEDISPFRGATDTPVLDFWWHLPWVSKPMWIPCMLSHLCDPQIHFWCDTCWLYRDQHGRFGPGFKPTNIRAAGSNHGPVNH